MNIIIVGGGIVGYSLAEHLLKDKHQLALIEQDEQLCAELSHKLDLQILNGSGSSPNLLNEAGLEKADMVLAVTPNDEVNLVVCALAAQRNIKRRIARLRSPELTSDDAIVDLGRLGVTSVIHPERVMADQVLQFIGTPHAVESANFEDGRVLVRGYRIRESMPLCGKTPMEIRQKIAPAIVLFVAINRQGRGMIPTGKTRLEPDDIVYALFPRDDMEAFLSLVGIEQKKHRKIIATGDSYASVELAERLQGSTHKVTFVSPNRDIAELIAGKVDGLDVLHGDCTDADLLRELRVQSASFFIAVSDVDDYNIMSCLLAKAEGAHEVVAASPDSRHDHLFNSIGIDHVINPRLTAARAILDIIARGQIGAVVKLSDIDIEAARFEVEPSTQIAGSKVKRIARKFKAGAIIGVIVRDEKIVLPGGETVIEVGDHVIVVTHHKNLAGVSQLFRLS
jgi:trk system potassium uptake protein TrkA